MRGKIRRTRSQIRRPRRLPRLRRARRPRLERRNFFRDGQAVQKMQRELQDLRRLPLSGAPACFLCFAEDGQPAGRQRVLSVSFRAEPPQSGGAVEKSLPENRESLYSSFGNTICIRPLTRGAKTRSTRRRSFSAARFSAHRGCAPAMRTHCGEHSPAFASSGTLGFALASKQSLHVPSG